MIGVALKWIVGALLSPLTRLGEKYLDNQKDKERLRAGTSRVLYQTDATVRSVKLTNWMGRAPLFLAEVATALYYGAILLDSTFPMEWLTPLELPMWFKPHFHVATASIFGIGVTDRWLNRRR